MRHLLQTYFFTVCTFVLALLFFSNNIRAQFQGNIYFEDSTVKVFDNGQELYNAWAGGFNNPQFSKADLNNDHLDDLVVFEKFPALVKTFINKGTPGNPKYVYSPGYSKNFPVVSDYLIMADYNRDNVPDLFQIGNGIDAPNSGYSVYRGYYNPQNQLCFTYYQNLFFNNDTPSTGPHNAECIPGDMPAIVDVDNDGDLDFISYSTGGFQLNYYKNVQEERHLPKDSIHIILRDRCWGKVAQSFIRKHTLNAVCSYAGLVILPGEKTTHTGNTICLFDADGDGDYDYLDGNVSFNDMVFLKNGRVENGGRDSMVAQDTTWQTGGKKISLPQWPTAFNIDYDGDGLKDLLAAPHAEDVSENYKCIWYYRNTGTATAPVFTFQTDSLLMDRTIDIGTAAYPMFYDYDKDGKPDLIIGSDGYYQAGGSFRSKLAYYHNTSTVGHPSFELVTKDLLNLFAQNYRGAAPAFGDLDNDGKDDMVLGHKDGTLSFYSNTAANNMAQPNWQLQQASLTDQNNTTITVFDYAMPFIYDINKDGKPDLLIGCFMGTIYYYENVSTTPGQLKLKYDTSKLGGIQLQAFASKCSPFIGKMDNTGKDYLVAGTNNGTIARYDGFQNGNTAIPFIQLDNQYSNINAREHASPTIADIDGDGKYEMVIGNELGGVTLYRQIWNVAVPGTNANKYELQLYPNPAETKLYAGVNGDKITDDAEAMIYNSIGQLITTGRKGVLNGTIVIDIAGVTPGMYFCFMRNGGKTYSGSFIKK